MTLPESCSRLSDRAIAAWLVEAVSDGAVPTTEAIDVEAVTLLAEQTLGRLRIDAREVDGRWHTVLHYDDGATVWIPMTGASGAAPRGCDPTI